MNICNCPEVAEYIEYVENNKDKINNERLLLIENIVRPFLYNQDVLFDYDTFTKCMKYCEKNYYNLFPYQKFIYAFIFLYSKEDSAPIFKTFIVYMARGNGKDGFLMPLFNFLQTPLYNIQNYHIDIIANNEKQAKNSFKVVHEMLENNKNKFKNAFYWSRELIKNNVTRSELRFNTSNAKTKDGQQAGANFYNEYHAYENYDQIGVFDSQLGKIPHARKFIATTNGYVRDGPLDDLLFKCKEILETGENDVRYFPFLCSLDSIEEVDNEEMHIKANPSMEFMPNLKRQIHDDFIEMKSLPSKRAEFITKRLNLPERNNEITVCDWNDILYSSFSDIEKRIVRETPKLTGESCIIGIDYADIRDFASAGVLFKIKGEYIFKQMTWICSNSPFFHNIKFANNFKDFGEPGFTDFKIMDSETLSIEEIVRWCREQTNEYFVQKIVMDTYRFSLFREFFEIYGFDIESRTNPYGVVRMLRRVSSVNSMVAPIVEVAFKHKKVNFGDSAIMRWYTNNTSVTIDKFGNKQFGKIEPKLRKNDGFMAFVAAMSCEHMLDEIVIQV